MRVAFVPRSVEIKPTFWRFVTIIFISSYQKSGEGLSEILWYIYALWGQSFIFRCGENLMKIFLSAQTAWGVFRPPWILPKVPTWYLLGTPQTQKNSLSALTSYGVGIPYICIYMHEWALDRQVGCWVVRVGIWKVSWGTKLPLEVPMAQESSPDTLVEVVRVSQGQSRYKKHVVLARPNKKPLDTTISCRMHQIPSELWS